MSNIMKCEPSESHANTFKWILKNYSNTVRISDIFQFCGSSCFLGFEDIGFPTRYCHFKITLHRYPAPYKTNISCHYSVCLKSKNGLMFATKYGEMRAKQEIDAFVLFQKWFDIALLTEPAPIICFSWAEDECSKLLLQAVPTEAEIIHTIDQANQTEETQISPVMNVCTHAACCINVLKRESQTTVAELPFSSNVCINEENETFQFLEEMSNDLRSFFESKTTTDCVLTVGETKFPAHRSVLSARSTVFHAMFHHDTSESQTGEVVIQDVDAAALGYVLYFIYTGKVRGLSSDTAAPMYTVADKYALISLRDKCLNYLLCNLSVENLCDAALLAHVHAETELENKVVKFIKERLQELIGTEKWKDFTDTHAKLANKFLCSALMSN